MFKNFKTWLVLFLLVVNTHADESMESGGSNGSDSADSEGSSGSASFEKPLGKSAENQKNEATNVMKCQESNPTNACTCPLTTSLKNQCIAGLNPCQQALFLQWAQQVETTVLVQVSLSTAQLSVAFAYSYQSFAKLYPDIDVVTRNCQIKPFGLNQLILGDFQNIALSFADETCGSAFNLDQNNNTSLFDGLRQAANNCGVGTTGSTVSGSTSSGASTGTTGSTVSGATTGTAGSTVSGATTGTAGSTVSGGSIGTGMPAACAGYYTSPGTPSTGSTVSGPTGTAGTGSTVSGPTGTGSTVSGSTGTGSTVSGSTGTGSTISGSTGTAGTGSTPTAPTGSTGTGATTVSGGTVAPSCTGITVAVNILIQNLLVIFQQTTLTYEQMMIQISITLQGWFAQYPQFQQTIMSQQISGFFSIQVLVDVSFKYQQSSMISNIFSGDVTTCPVLVAIKNAYSQPVCGATTGTTATGSTGTATGSTGTATGSTGSTATGSTGTATGSTGSTATGSTGTATATGSTPAGTTAGATGATTGSTSSGATSGTTSASSGNCIPLDIQQKLQAFYDLLVIQFQSVTDTNQRLKIFSNIYYQFTKDIPSCVPFLRWIKISGFGSISDIIFISGVITFPQVDTNGIDALINNTNGWNNTIFVQSMYTYAANLNVTYSFQGFSVSAVQWSMWRNIYITGNISLIISNINMSYRQKHVQIHGVLNGFFTKYTNQNVFYCMPVGNFGTLADWSQAVRVSPAWNCPIPRACFQPRNNLIKIKSDNSTHFTTGWNNMVATLSPSDASCVSSFSAQINTIVYGSVPSGGQVAQIYKLTIQITAAKSACPNAASSIDGCLVGKWGHLKKFVDCQINASTTQYMSK